MLEILNRDYKQNVYDIMEEFPDCQFGMLIDDPMDDGYLLAISRDPSSCSALSEFITSNSNRGLIARCGIYGCAYIGGIIECN
ncbi:MAG: hypothetical protein NC548_28565 [Lachnospiraceae bacterium]|nr:hypothetical protein [Lachnospiraceae bacterium]